MSMKQLVSFMSRVQSNDSLRSEIQHCGDDNSCVLKVPQNVATNFLRRACPAGSVTITK